MSNFIISFMAVLALAFAPIHAKAAAKEETAIIVLIENGGSVTDQDAAMLTIKHLLHQLTSLQRKRATRDATISIVLSAAPNRITWSGTPAQLAQQGQQVLEKITFQPTFSDLVLSFEQINTTLRLSQPNTVRLYWIGSGIHVPFQDTDEEIQIKVPQQLPADCKFGEMTGQFSVLKLYNIHEDQDEVFLNYLMDQGVMDRKAKGEIDFILMDAAQTAANLEHLL